MTAAQHAQGFAARNAIVTGEARLDILEQLWDELDASSYPPDEAWRAVIEANNTLCSPPVPLYADRLDEARRQLSSGITAENAEARLSQYKRPTDRFRVRMAADITLAGLPDFLIDETVVENSVHAFYGATGAGKTFAAIDMALCVATGRQWFGRDTLPAAVLWLAAEDSFGVDKRVRAWLAHNGLNEAPFASMDGDVFRLQQQDTLDAIALQAERLLQITGMSRVLIVADTLSKVSGGIDENSGQDLSGVLLAFDKLRHRLPTATICVIHHSGKSEGAGLRGHSSLSQSLDSFALVKKNQVGHTIEFEKVKNSELPPRIGFTLNGVIVGKYKNGKDITSCVVEHRDLKPVEVAPLKVSAANQAQLAALATSIRDSGVEIPGALTDFVSARGVPVEQWKTDAHEMLHPGAKKKAAYEDWRRARRSLTDAGAIKEVEHNGVPHVFLVDSS